MLLKKFNRFIVLRLKVEKKGFDPICAASCIFI